MFYVITRANLPPVRMLTLAGARAFVARFGGSVIWRPKNYFQKST